KLLELLILIIRKVFLDEPGEQFRFDETKHRPIIRHCRRWSSLTGPATPAAAAARRGPRMRRRRWATGSGTGRSAGPRGGQPSRPLLSLVPELNRKSWNGLEVTAIACHQRDRTRHAT